MLTRLGDIEYRPYQQEAIEKISSFFDRADAGEVDENPYYTTTYGGFHALLYAKCRFGKCLVTYGIAHQLKAKVILVVCVESSVIESWCDDAVKIDEYEFVKYPSSTDKNPPKSKAEFMKAMKDGKPKVVFITKKGLESAAAYGDWFKGKTLLL